MSISARETYAPALQTALFPSATLAEFYRFALLLTGTIKMAEQVMAETIDEAEGQLGQFRSETSRQAWLAARIRERCLKNDPPSAPPFPRLLREERDPHAKHEILKIEAYLLAQRFHALPEPGRSALALFYLEMFTLEEIAQLLRIDQEKLPDAIGLARDQLQQSLRGIPEPASAS